MHLSSIIPYFADRRFVKEIAITGPRSNGLAAEIEGDCEIAIQLFRKCGNKSLSLVFYLNAGVDRLGTRLGIYREKFTMRPLNILTMGIVLVVGACAGSNEMAAKDEMAKKNMSHAHMGHVTKSWQDTPGNKGLLTTAIAESKVAVQHAGFAAGKPENLKWMQTHTHHVLHAVEPSLEGKGPGLGYGVIKAAAGCAKHIGFAANSDGASKNVKTHSVHVATSCNNTVARAQEIVVVGKNVLAANDAATAAPQVKKMQMLSNQLLSGADANGDGKITWKKGEGGLNEAQKHMGFMAKGESM